MKRQNRTGDDDSEDDFESQKDKKKIRSSNTDNEDCTSDNKNEKQNCFTCKVCNKRFTLLKNLCRHEISHRSVVKCEQCGGSFSRQDSLQRHKRTHHNENRRDNNKGRDVKCNICDKVFNKFYNLKRHMRTVHKQDSNKGQKQLFTCRYCESEFGEYSALFAHVMENHPLNQSGGRDRGIEKSLIDTASPQSESKSAAENQNKNQSENASPQSESKSTAETQNTNQSENDENIELSNENKDNQDSLNTDNERDESALQNSVQNRIILPRSGGGERYDLLTFFANVRSRILTYLQSRIRSMGGIKWNLCVQVEMERTDNGGDSSVSTPFFRSRTYMSLTLDGLNEHDLNEALQKMYASLEKYMRDGSGWFLRKVLKLEIHTIKYRPLSGSSYLPLPRTLLYNSSLLNIENEDEKCFLWCILASLHPSERNAVKVETYCPFTNELNMSGIQYPVSLAQIDRFEKQNENISINVFTFQENEIVPLKITSNTRRLHHVNLLWIKYGQVSHYVLIRDLNTFLFRSKSHNQRMFFCPYCLHGFVRNESLQNHITYCSTNEAQKVELPAVGDSAILEFKDFEKELKVSFTIYADFETLNRRVSTCLPEPTHSSTTSTTKLEVCGFAYKVVCADNRYTKPTVVYRGSDASQKFITSLLREQKEIENILSNIEPMIITSDDFEEISRASQCCLCQKDFTPYEKVHSTIVRHHDHLTGDFIGMAHNQCNLKCKQAKHTCVIFHNLKKFDAHIICQSIGEFKGENLKCIAQSTENYVSFSLGNLRFIDSLQFLPSSLQSLVENLKCDGQDAFEHLTEEFPNSDDVKLLLRKGVYPYDYMDRESKFDEHCLPPAEAFYNALTKQHISEQDYKHACDVFAHFEMTSMGSYHDLYLKCDVILLCCVFETFRSMCMEQYGLDPCHFYTSPGLSWASCLKMTGVQLELMTDIDQVLFIEKGIRGGISQISNRYKQANNPLLSDYDSEKKLSHILYLDMCNLYGFAMQQPLPTSDFQFLKKREINQLDIRNIPADGEKGYIFEVNLRYPPELHDKHNDYPLAPERKAISDD
ncbi:uncharacterized protein LOC128548718, partial [Mercenaria mercenaria]|uniref:uncharacterized protein LOC128548718 n=1 Tax=Mercenaria mercenaria TaxID=6596 RepID=UPI00234F5365